MEISQQQNERPNTPYSHTLNHSISPPPSILSTPPSSPPTSSHSTSEIFFSSFRLKTFLESDLPFSSHCSSLWLSYSETKSALGDLSIPNSAQVARASPCWASDSSQTHSQELPTAVESFSSSYSSFLRVFVRRSYLDSATAVRWFLLPHLVFASCLHMLNDLHLVMEVEDFVLLPYQTPYPLRTSHAVSWTLALRPVRAQPRLRVPEVVPV